MKSTGTSKDLKIMEDPQFIKSEPETLPDTRESSKKEQPYSDDSKEPNLSFPHQLVEVKKENEIKAEPVTVPGNQHKEQEITREVKEEILNEETNSSSVDNSSLTTPGNIPVAGSILNCVAPFKITKKDGSHSCATCGKTFTRLEHVRRHSLTHVGEQSLSCSTCGKTFSRLDHMKRHELIHLDERPHLCTTCGKTFTEEVHLKTHSLVHLQGKKYSCSQCGGYFKHESSLKRHISTHFGNAPNTWGKAYTEKVYLKKNQVIQNKKEPHVCRTCGQMFMRLSHFTRHRLLHKSDGSRLDL